MTYDPTPNTTPTVKRRLRRGPVLIGAISTALVLVILVAIAFATGLIGDSDSDAANATATPPIPDDLAPEAVTDPAFPSLTYGVHAFLWWNETARPFDLDQIRLMRFSHVKQRFAWGDIEPERDVWVWDRAEDVVDEVEHRGLNVVARLDGPPAWAQVPVPADDPTVPPVDLDAWATYCGTLAGHFQGRIAAYQVWNEPNLDREWLDHPPNAAAYVQLLAACSAAIREADPGAIIISAGLAPTGTWLPKAIPDMDYLRMMYDAGAAEWFDVLGLNAPGYAYPPDASPEFSAEQHGGHRWFVFRHVEDMRAIMVQAGDAHKQIAILEVGWTTDTREGSPYAWHAVDPQTQADYLVGAYEYAAEHWRPWVGLMTTIFIADIGWTEDNEEWWWAINDGGYGAGWGGRPAYFALANMARWIDDDYIPPRDPGSPEATTVDPIAPREGAE